MRILITLAFTAMILVPISSMAQCDPSVPLYVIDLSSNADTSWVLYEEDALTRNGQCCSADPNENCIQFQITLHPNAAGIFFDYDGAGAFGSLNWQVDCGPEYNLKDTICVTDPGPFTLTFCKPGTDNGNYTLISVSKPTFPDDQTVPLNCTQPVSAAGVTPSSISWQSISPGAPGDYDYLLSCTDCLDPVYSPEAGGPVEVEYQVCGYPILDYCVGNFLFCDTVKFTTQDSILLNITPATPTFCSGGDVTLTAAATGGDGNYTYFWYDGSLNLLGTGANFTANAAGSYTCEVRDGNYQPLYCDNFSQTIIVGETLPPVVDAGEDQVLCADGPEASLSGTVQYATGGVWSGGSGTYTPSNTDLSITYTPTQAEIQAGSVTLTLTSTGAGSSCPDNSDDVQIFFVDTIQTSLSDTTLGCFGESALINPTISGGLAPLQFSWTDGTTTSSNTLGEGTHCLTITDANGCQATECLTISAAPELDLTMSSTPATTNGGSDGTATATPSGGTSPYNYLWSNAGTNQTEVGLPYGVYTVTVTDDAGCTRSESVVVNEPRCDGFTLSTNVSNVLCNSDSTGAASVTPSGGLVPYTIVWDDYATQTTDTAWNLPAGVYEVSVTDNDGCVAIATAAVTEPGALINTMTHTDATTQGGSDGSAQANVIGGFGSYYYAWSTAESTSSINGLSTGWYTVDITDDNSCLLTDSVFINEPPCNEFQIHVSTVSPLCNGYLTGEATLSVINGIAPYSINWSTGQTDTTYIDGVSAGIHTVEVTDAQGCYTALNYGISQPSALSVGLAATPSTCFGSSNGTIDMTISGGTYPYYYYSWNSGQTTEDLINLDPGTYEVTIIDTNGCQTTSSTILTDPDPLAVTLDSMEHVTCYGGTDGAIYISVSGGNMTYTYDWSNGATSQDLVGIDVGGYILNVTDGSFCTLGEPLTYLIAEPHEVEADTIIINCPVPGAGQTTVDVTPIGGTGSYAISSDGGTSFGAYGDYTLTLTTGQSYDIQVKDTNDCISPLYPITIDPTVVIDSINFNLCYAVGQTDEAIDVYISGGTPDYAISTDGGTNYGVPGTYTLPVPVNASYQVVAMDNKGCASTVSNISLPDVFSSSISVTTDYNGFDITCNGASDGEATVVASGGSGTYSYLWNNAATTDVNSALSAGTYTVEIEDGNGCIINDTVTLTEPTSIVESYTASVYASGDNISCNGYTDGSIDFTIAGGTGTYTFDWDNDGTGDNDDMEDLSNLGAGTYIIVAADANGCSVSDTVTLTEPSGPTQSLTTSIQPSGYGVSCYHSSDGWIDFTLTGGAPPYTYDWDNDGTGDNDDTEDLSDLPAGTYNLIATDVNGCIITQSVTLVEPDSLMLNGSIVNTSCYNYLDGSIDITVTGGTQPYAYTWSTGASSEDLMLVGNGAYMIGITDAMGCGQSGTFVVTEPDSLYIELFSPLNFHDHNVDLFGGSDGEINATVYGGTEPYNYSWSNGEDTEDLFDLTAGEYELYVVDNQGCEALAVITLTQPLELELPSAFSPNSDMANDKYVIHGVEAYPDNTFTVINRWGNVVYETTGYDNTWGGENMSGELIPDGVYFVILTINGEEIEETTYVHVKTH